MAPPRAAGVVVAIVHLALAACGGEPDAGCTEDRLLPCACADGTAGTRACGSDACVCEAPGCSLRHVDALEFGRLPPGFTSERELLLANDGASPCALSAIRPDGCGGAISIELVFGPLTIPAGGVVSVPVRFQPEDDGEVACALELDLSDSTAVDTTVRLHGTGDASCLTVGAGPIALEANAPGCATAAAAVPMTNGCDVAVRLDEVVLEGEAFVLLAQPPVPVAIAPGVSSSVTVGFRPEEPGDHRGRLRLSFRGFEPWTVDLAGTALEPTWVTEHFETASRPEVDVLFVIDNGSGMADHLGTIEENLRPFLVYAQAGGIDLHLGVTTTGLQPDGDCPGGVGGGEDGRLFPVDGGERRILTAEADEETWSSRFAVGACRAGPNQVFEAALRAVTPPVSDSADDPRHPEAADGNAGFLRPEALLAIVAITDRADTSPEEPAWYYNALQGLKGFRNTHLFRFHAITGDRGQGCSREGAASAEAGDRLIDLADRTAGPGFQSICAEEWFGLRETMVTSVCGWNGCFYLAAAVADLDGDGEVTDVAGELEVRVDGEVAASRGPQGQRIWRYDPYQIAICFDPLASPGYDRAIDIHYREACP